MTALEPDLIGISIFTAMLFTVTTSLYAAHQYINAFESHLSNCELIKDTKATYKELDSSARSYDAD